MTEEPGSYGPRGHKESDTTERLTLMLTVLDCTCLLKSHINWLLPYLLYVEWLPPSSSLHKDPDKTKIHNSHTVYF